MSNLLTKSAAAALLTAGALAAQASPADVQVVDPLGALAADLNIFGSFAAGGKTFDEFLQFSVPNGAALDWTITASVANKTGLAALSSNLYSGTLTGLSHDASDPAPLAAGVSFTDDSDPSSPTFWTFDPGTLELAALAGGDYTLVISGATLRDGGAFGGTLGVTPLAPVPEPDSYAMFMAGLGILGAIARRRQPTQLLTAPGREPEEEVSL